MRGHGKGGIWSLSWSVESTVLVSAGADNTVRIWDVLMETADSAAASNAKPADGVAGTAKVDGSTASGAAPAGAVATSTGKKAKPAKENVVTVDQISAFPTKHSPVYKVMFTRMNLVLAGGAYLPPPQADKRG